MKQLPTIKTAALLLATAAVITFASCNNGGTGTASQSEVDSLRTQIKELASGNEIIAKNLATFDTLDYTVFSNQDWTRLHESNKLVVI